MAQPEFHTRRALTASLAAATSFCGLAYQQLFALTLADATGDFVLSQAFALGIFLLGMGVGAWRADKVRDPRRSLAWLELGIALLGMFSVVAVQLPDTAAHLQAVWPIAPRTLVFVFSTPFVFLTGALTGAELPLLIKLAGGFAGRVLAWNYAGALLGTAIVPTVLVPWLDVNGAASLVALLNFVLAGVLLGGRRQIAALSAGLALAGFWLWFEPTWRDVHIKSIYSRASVRDWQSFKGAVHAFRFTPPSLRHRSLYQWIDLVHPFEESFALYLDRRVQFNELNQERYHQTLVHGAVHLLGHEPRRVLVLGGGDGLLLPELFKYANLERVDLVELDGKMLELARNLPRLQTMNRHALSDPRVHVYPGDAFQFVRRARERYDLVISDLPFPVSYDLSLLFTVEFFSMVKARLNASGVFALDFPSRDDGGERLAPLMHTLKAAGWAAPLAFGAEDLFVAAAADGRELRLKFPEALARLDNGAIFNMQMRLRESARALERPARVNSVFFPFLFDGGGEDGRPRLVRHDDAPGLWPEFLARFERFLEAEGARFAWPSSLLAYHARTLRETRDSAEEIAGRLMPRFAYEISRTQVSPVFFETRQPDILHREWRRAFGFAPAGAWVGVTWRGAEADYHELWLEDGKPVGWQTKIFRGPELLGQHKRRFSEWKTSGDALAPVQEPETRRWQNKIEREFHIPPREYRFGPDGEEYLYFP